MRQKKKKDTKIMVEMPDEVIKTFENIDCYKAKALTWVATITEEGEPHLAPVCFVKPIGQLLPPEGGSL